MILVLYYLPFYFYLFSRRRVTRVQPFFEQLIYSAVEKFQKRTNYMVKKDLYSSLKKLFRLF